MVAIVCTSHGAAARPRNEVHDATPPPRVLSLEARLLAPCCWNQTLDTHESDLATELRLEIARRAAEGEAHEAIEADLVERYGARIRAFSPTSPLPTVLACLFLAAGLLGTATWWRARAWRRPALEAAVPPGARRADEDEYDRRLTEELAAQGTDV
jgi:cytochrome c-type biogenesis protein CcmH